MEISQDDLRLLTQLTWTLYNDPDNQAEASKQLAHFSVTPQNLSKFIQLLRLSTDIYLLQFTIQSLRRIVIKYHTHLSSTHIIPLCQAIISYIEVNAPNNIPYPTLTTMSLLFGTVLRYFWVSTPEVRTFVGDAAGFLAVSVQHCHAGSILLTELVDEVANHGSNSIAAQSHAFSHSVSLNQSVTVPFGSHMIPAIVLAASSALYQVLSLYGYQQSPRYIQSGHDWNSFPLRSPLNFDPNILTQQTAPELIKNLLQLIYRCIRFDSTGFGNSRDDEDSYAPTSVSKSTQWTALFQNNFLLLLVVSAAQACSNDLQIVQISLQLLSSYISVKSSMWSNEVQKVIAGKYVTIFVIMILDSLSQPVSQTDNTPVFLTQPRLFQVATGLLHAIFKQFSLVDVVNLFHPLIPCDLHFDPSLQQQYESLRHETVVFFTTPGNPGGGWQGFDAWTQQVGQNAQTGQGGQTGQAGQSEPAIIKSKENEQTSNPSQSNPYSQLYQDNSTSLMFIEHHAALLTTGEHPCRVYQQAVFSSWLFRIYNFTIKVYSLGFRDSASPGQDSLSITSLTPHALLTEAVSLGDISLMELLDIYRNLLTIWTSLAEAYTSAVQYAPTTNKDKTSASKKMINGMNEIETQTSWPKFSMSYASTTKPNLQRRNGISSVLTTLLDDLPLLESLEDVYSAWTVNGSTIDEEASEPKTNNSNPAKKKTVFLVSLQHHLDKLIISITDDRHYSDLVTALPTIFPEISSSYLRALISTAGGLFEDASFEDIAYSSVEGLSELFFGSQLLQEQLSIYSAIARAAPISLSKSLEELWNVLKSNYLQHLTILPSIVHRLQLELNSGSYKLLSQYNGSNSQTAANPYGVYSLLMTSLFSEQHADKNVIQLTNEEKFYLTTLFRLEAQISMILNLINILFQPKHNFFTHKNPADFDAIISIHTQCANIVMDSFRWYCVRYGHYNSLTTPPQYQKYQELIPSHIEALSLETLLSYLTITSGISPTALSPHYTQSQFGVNSTNRPFFSLSTPMFLIPTSSYFAHSLLNSIGAFIDSLVYRQYMSKSHSYASLAATGTKNFSDEILSQTYNSLQSSLLCFSSNSDRLPAPKDGANGNHQNDENIEFNIFGQKLLKTPPQHVISTVMMSGQASQVVNSRDSPYYLVVNDDGIVTFQEILNLSAFLAFHVLNTYPICHLFNVPLIELSLSFLLHLNSAISLSIILPTLPAWRILSQHHQMLAITRVPSTLPLPLPFSYALDAFDFESASSSGAFDNPNQQTPHLNYNQRLIYSLPIHQQPHAALLRHYRNVASYFDAIQFFQSPNASLKHTSSTPQSGFSRTDYTTCVQLYYELLARVTKRSPTLLTSPFDTMFGAITIVIDRSSQSQHQDPSLFASTMILICNALTGAGRIAAGEHVYQWVARFLPLVVRVGLHCSVLMYNDRKKNTGGAVISNSNDGGGNQLLSGLQGMQFDKNNKDASNELESILNELDMFQHESDDIGGLQDDEHMRAVRNIHIDPIVAQALANTLSFMTTCCSNRGRNYPLTVIIDQALTLVLSFFSATKHTYSQYANQNERYGEFLFDIDENDSQQKNNTSFGLDGNTGSSVLNEKSSQEQQKYLKLNIIFPLQNEAYFSCLIAALTLSSELMSAIVNNMVINTTTEMLALGASAGINGETDTATHYIQRLLPEVLINIYHIPIPILISNIELITEYLGLLVTLFNNLLSFVLISIEPAVLSHNIKVLFAIIDAYYHVPVQHPHYTTLALASTCLQSFFGYLPKTTPLQQITNHDCLFHITQHHVAPNYYSYLTDAMINGTQHAMNQAWPQILQMNQHNNAQKGSDGSHRAYQVENIVNNQPTQSNTTPSGLGNLAMFPTGVLQSDQNSLLSIFSFLNTHTLDNIIPEQMVSYFTRAAQQQQLSQALLQSKQFENSGSNSFSRPYDFQIQEQQAQLTQLQQVSEQTMLKNLYSAPQHQIDTPLVRTVLSSSQRPYPLSSSITLQHALNIMKGLIKASTNGHGGWTMEPAIIANNHAMHGTYSTSNEGMDNFNSGNRQGDAGANGNNNIVIGKTNIPTFNDLNNISSQLITITMCNLFNNILFDSDSTTPCLFRLIPFLIHFYPKLFNYYINRVLIPSISSHQCYSVYNISPELVALRIQQQANVTQVWASVVVSQQERGNTFPPMGVINLPTNDRPAAATTTTTSKTPTSIISSGGTGIIISASGAQETSTSPNSEHGMTYYEISSLLDMSTAHVMSLLSKCVAKVVNKPGV
jgi:hypothetical protein